MCVCVVRSRKSPVAAAKRERAIMANPRKFSEKIALLNQKEAQETAAFEAIMREVSDVTSRVRKSQSRRQAARWVRVLRDLVSRMPPSPSKVPVPVLRNPVASIFTLTWAISFELEVHCLTLTTMLTVPTTRRSIILRNTLAPFIRSILR
ncbi:uncharacterized protein LOC124956010 isoform X4 [Vespa velutina]|uniref:uncharacterized protein LOC124956010 isoform X4 n=1 Tax=Vespa velutina TaxID=202808 RepID=UPI001FB47740|nr:uncharacterized protein LOC124956010 isoform X4 [Vespa velutina]